MRLYEVNRKFEYMPDRMQYGFKEVWLPLQNVGGRLIGDCESYAITLKQEVDEYYLWQYHYCKINGNGHCVLVCKDMVIDNNIRRPISLQKYKQAYEITGLRPYRWYELVWKFASAWVLKQWIKLRKDNK